MRIANRHNLLVAALLLAVSFAVASPSQAQSDGYITNGNIRGKMSFGTFQNGDIDNISLATGALNLNIPLTNRKGRGIDNGLAFVYSSKHWIVSPTYDPNTGNLTNLYWVPSHDQAAVGQVVGTGEGGSLDWTVNQYTCNYKVGSNTLFYIETVLSNFIYVGPDGAKFQFPNSVFTRSPNIGFRNCIQPVPGSDVPPPPPPNVINVPIGYSDSGTMKLDTSTSPYVVSFKDGRQTFTSPTNNGFNPVTYEVIDTNGNLINGPGDTMGRTALTDSVGAPVTYSPTGSGGSTAATQFPTTGSGCIHQYTLGTSGGPAVLQLPNGQSYTFTYDPHFGEVTKVTLPAGGYISYVYQTIAGMDLNPFEVVQNGNVSNTCWTSPLDSRRVTERHVSADGVTESVWHYSYAPLSSAPGSQTTVTDPLGNVTVYTFTDIGIDEPRYESERDVYDNASHLLMKKVNAWQIDTGAVQTNQDGSYVEANKNPRISSTTTTLADTNQVSQVNTTYDRSNPVTTGGILINETRMNVMETDEYDYGSGAPGPLLRKTVFDYLHYDNSVYLNAHIWDRTSSRNVYDNAGNTCKGIAQPCAKTNYLYDSTAISLIAGVLAHDDAGHSSGFTTRGNLTETDVWLNTTGTTLATVSLYDAVGNMIRTTDPKSNITNFGYTDSWVPGSFSTTCPAPTGSTNAFLTQSTNALNQVTKQSHFFCSSLTGSATDPNNQVLSWSYDHMDRIASQSQPDGGLANFTYTDPASPTPTNPMTAQMSMGIGNGLTFMQTIKADGLGRLFQTQLNSDPQGVDLVDTTYDGLGRVHTSSNPHRSASNPTDGIVCQGTVLSGVCQQNGYDALGRATVVTEQDGSVVTTSYSGNCSTVTDETGKQRKICADGVGRLVQVFEDPAGLNYETDYAYDALNNLTQVVQKGGVTDTTRWRNRTFTYDSLSRLLTATNPESGTISYTYDANGNVLTKMDARGYITNYSPSGHAIDALNRVIMKTYSNGDPPVTYTYDQSACLGQASCYNIGHVTGMIDAAGSENWSYDRMGRVLADQRTTNSITKTTAYSYNFDGSVATVTYPSGRTVTYTIDAAGRPLSAADQTNSYASSATYTPQGALASLQNGPAIVSTLYYNTRLQPCRAGVNSSGTAPSSCSDATNHGNIMDYTFNFSLGAGDNGNVIGINNNRDATRSQSFAYDQFSRLATAQTTAATGSNCWSETYGIDAWGNLSSIGSIPSSTCTNNVENLSATVWTNNRFTSPSVYDAAGNMTSPSPTVNYTYNAENQLTSAAAVNYTYDGDGKRVQKSNGTLYWYGTGSDPLVETNASGATANEYVYFGGKRVARLDSSGSVFYYFSDHLGTSRVILQAGQTTPCYDADFYPFGGERVVTNTCSQNYKFTGKERDGESGLDNFEARYVGSILGRFMSADAPLVGQHPDDPQSWNLYAYARNNPLSRVDPNGHDCVYLDNNGGTDPNGPGGASIDHNSSPKECGDSQGIWINGTVESLRYVDSDPDTGVVFAMSHDGETIGRTWVGPDWRHEDKGAQSISPEKLAQKRDQTIMMWQLFAIMAAHNPGVPPDDDEASTPVGRRGKPLNIGPEGAPPMNRPAKIGGRDYSGHAIDGMQEVGVTPMFVEEVIAAGQVSPGNKPDTTVHTAQGLTVVTNSSGKVVTVFYRGN